MFVSVRLEEFESVLYRDRGSSVVPAREFSPTQRNFKCFIENDANYAAGHFEVDVNALIVQTDISTNMNQS